MYVKTLYVLSDVEPEMFCMCRLLVLSIFVAVTYMMTWSIVPRFLKLMIQLSSQVRPIELFLFCSVGLYFCRYLMMILTSWCCISFLIIFFVYENLKKKLAKHHICSLLLVSMSWTVNWMQTCLRFYSILQIKQNRETFSPKYMFT